MKSSQKLILLCLLMIILMVCNCSVIDNIKNILGLETQSNQESTSNQETEIVEEWANFYNFNILPQEKILFYLWPETDKVIDHTFVSTLFVVSEITTTKMTSDPDWLAKLAGLPITHPIVSVTPSDFTTYIPHIWPSFLPVVLLIAMSVDSWRWRAGVRSV